MIFLRNLSLTRFHSVCFQVTVSNRGDARLMATHVLCGITQSHWRRASKVLDIPFIPKMLGGQRENRDCERKHPKPVWFAHRAGHGLSAAGDQKSPEHQWLRVPSNHISKEGFGRRTSNSFLQQSSDCPQVAPLRQINPLWLQWFWTSLLIVNVVYSVIKLNPLYFILLIVCMYFKMYFICWIIEL